MSLFPLLAVCFLCWLSCAAGAADVSSPPPRAIWGGLVYATYDPHPPQAPEHVRPFAQKLKNIFGYNQFDLVGENAQRMDTPEERWLVPSKDFALTVRTHNVPGERYPTKIVLYENHRRIAEIQTHLSSDSPLFIRGPQYAGGQLVIVLHVMDAADVPARPVKPPLVAANPTPVPHASPPRPKLNPVAISLASPPRINPNPVAAVSIVILPKDRLNPPPPDRFGAGPATDHIDHLGGGVRGGDFDSKLSKP